MRAIFPFLGNFILSKKDIEKLQKIYIDNANESFDIDMCICKNGVFNYFRDNSFFIYDQTTRASISELKSALGINKKEISTQSTKTIKDTPNKIKKEKKLDDNDIMSNSFFTTLKML